MTAGLLRSGGIMVIIGGLFILSSAVILGTILFQGFFGPPAPLFFAIIFFVSGLGVAVLGAGVFMWRFANGPPGE